MDQEQHLKMGEHSFFTLCGETVDSTAEVADWARTYGPTYCADCDYGWRQVLRDAGVDVALLDCQRHDAQRAA